MYTKDPSKWNYEILMDIVEGPLLNPKRFEEAFMVSKFGRRLMSFFHPLSRQFSDMRATPVSTSGCTPAPCFTLTLLLFLVKQEMDQTRHSIGHDLARD